jgi:biotin carboxyl carrier protein
MKYIVTLNGKSYEVEVEKGNASIVRTENIPVSSVQKASEPTSKPVAAPAADKQNIAGNTGEAVKAPMPGVVLDIKVSPGTAVKKGSVLLILEAMKMENEITAPRDGVIAQINASKGSSVNTGDILVVFQ